MNVERRVWYFIGSIVDKRLNSAGLISDIQALRVDLSTSVVALWRT
jgi:hypothetical protein